MKKTIRFSAIFLYLFMVSASLFAQTRTVTPQRMNFEFIDQNINDILYAFSTYSKNSIVADDTVSGRASFQFSGTDFDEAFNAFLLSNRLYVEKSPTLWIVSRILITQTDGKITLDALDASPGQLLEKLSQKTSSTIIQDVLPNVKLSLHLENEAISEIISLIIRPFNDYEMNQREGYIQISRRIAPQPIAPFPSAFGQINIQESGGIFEVSIEQARLGDILEQLFLTARKEYASFVQSNQVIDRLKFSGKTFADTLTLILEQGNGEYSELDNFWYVFPLQQNEIIKRIRDDGKEWHRFELKYIDQNDFMPLLQSRFPGIQVITVSNRTDFLVFADNKTTAEVQGYVSSTDIPRRTEAVKLKYIKPEDLFKALPPSVKRDELVDSGNGNTLFFTGTPERLALFLKDLELIDRPQTRIRYDLLIIQFQETSDLNYGFSLSSRQMQPGDMTMISGELGNLLNLNFDVITVFGYQFAARFNAALAENQASVFADTKLFGLSGQEIQFQNTSTYRYRDSNIDPDTGKPIYSGVTRELTSGLVLKINGWVSGDGMITTTVNASVSKRGADVSSSIGNPPPTSEKILTTQVRSRSGETVILSGLKQNDSTIIEERVPAISKVPLIGWLFRSKKDTKENTEMVIYLVPHIDLANDEYTFEGRKTASLYERFVEPFLSKM